MKSLLNSAITTVLEQGTQPMYVYEMTFQLDACESYREFYLHDNESTRSEFHLFLQKANEKEQSNLFSCKQSSLEEIEFLNEVFKETNNYIEKMKNDFIHTGKSALNEYTFITVKKIKINDSVFN
ncbi:hypothetical protein SAMN05444584_1449 [Acinetobacter apis]|uniref:Uncharacterized protein n=1 Tax=Acinetobacter apis TaxID=1229165 RepID=A0A217EG86_9GAMM|nr:hypothetical protein SAMN05444584_1449 [Acinetobacter apis]